MTRIALYPGSFDPPTRGHEDIIARGLSLFDRLIVAIAINPKKTPLFSVEERMEALRTRFPDTERVVFHTFQGRLLVDYAKEHNATAILRGLRSGTDLDYESAMTAMNRALAPSIETVFLLSNPSLAHVSSSLVKEVASLGGDISHAVSPHVASMLQTKF